MGHSELKMMANRLMLRSGGTTEIASAAQKIQVSVLGRAEWPLASSRFDPIPLSEILTVFNMASESERAELITG